MLQVIIHLTDLYNVTEELDYLYSPNLSKIKSIIGMLNNQNLTSWKQI